MKNNTLKLVDELKKCYSFNDEDSKHLLNIFSKKSSKTDIYGACSLLKAINKELTEILIELDKTRKDIDEIKEEILYYELILSHEEDDEVLNYICIQYSVLQETLNEMIEKMILQIQMKENAYSVLKVCISLLKSYLETYFTECQARRIFSGFEYNYVREHLFINE